MLFAESIMKCGQYLGMRNGYIEDFQLWSPSEITGYPARAGRPGAGGWCPLKRDWTTPFLQVCIDKKVVLLCVCVFFVCFLFVFVKKIHF